MSTPESLHRERLYENLLLEFGEFAKSIGGWSSNAGVYLDGILWAHAEKLRLADVPELPRVSAVGR